MKWLTLRTDKYERQLTAFLQETAVPPPKRPARVARCACDPAFVDALAGFLEEIVLYENPVCRHSPKLRGAARRIRETDDGTRERLRQYLGQHKTLHIEGYTAFRMEAYKYKLDRLMIDAIKRLKLTE